MHKQKKLLVIFVLISFIISLVNGLELSKIDDLYHDGKYLEGLKILQEKFDRSNPAPAIIWRITRMIYEIADKISKKNKQEKIDKFTEAMNIASPYLNIDYGNNGDRARIIFWYAANYGARGEVIGIKESLDIIPELFDFADKSLSIDPDFAPSYLLKGRIDKAVPFFLGGDKFRMAINFSKAIENDSKDMSILVDAADAFIHRNWDVKKKKKLAEKKKITDGTPQNITDKEHAKEILNQTVGLYKSLKNPSEREKLKYNKALNLLKKIE
ncbi:MAG: hypothetical protein KAT05_17455 [Spirochaetes bacterium]|nr:hypothetical protein [Spirochaetota bacterium]